MNKTRRRLTALIWITLALASEARERWLFLGDSITQAGGYVDSVETWFLLNDPDAPEILDLGLSSETVSGLTEPDHRFPRPDLHSRLSRILDRTQPDVVIACYGMNCAIYHPFDAERFDAYQKGIHRLASEVQARGATIILLTPPPYAGRVNPKAPPAPGQAYGFKTPTPEYNDVLARYAEWILSLDGKNGVRALTIRPGLERFMEASYPREAIHPAPYGHNLIAEAFLRGIGKTTGSDLLETGIDARANDPKWQALHQLVQQERELYERALLCDIGHKNPGIMKKYSLPMSEATQRVQPIRAKIRQCLQTTD